MLVQLVQCSVIYVLSKAVALLCYVFYLVIIISFTCTTESQIAIASHLQWRYNKWWQRLTTSSQRTFQALKQLKVSGRKFKELG